MIISSDKKAEILVQALPYIQKYNNKIIVIKFGGMADNEQELIETAIGDIVLLSQIGVKVILVQASDSKLLVNLINNGGGNAIGICGVDGNTVEAEANSDGAQITDVNVELLSKLIESNYIPVLTSVGCDKQGDILTLDADMTAARIAGAIKAASLINMTHVKGILKDVNDESTLINAINASEVPALIQNKTISGGMVTKALCCVEAIRRGVKRVFILDGRIPHSVLIEILSDEGSGTMFY